jgi:hypothetical protein
MRVARYLLVAGLNVAAHASPMCALGTLATYEALAPGPAGGCTVGPLTFHDFGFAVVTSTGGALAVTAAGTTVTPVSGPANFGLQYSSGGFSVTAGQSIQYLLTYTVDPEPPIIHGFGVLFDVDGPTPPGSDTISSLECQDSAFTGTTCPTSTVLQTVFDNGVTFSHDSILVFGSPLMTLGDRTTITLDATSGGTANFTSLTETVFTPEPSLGLLVTALGFLMIGLRRGRKTSGATAIW